MKQKLLTILVCLASAVIALALTLQNPSEDEVDLPSPHIVIIGSTGVGKSSLANVFLGESPMCFDCTFPICKEGSSCTKQTTYAVGKWLGTGPMFTVVDTPGFGDSDQDDSVLVDQMMTVLKDTVKSANALLLVLKGDHTRVDGSLQQMLREMKSLFGDDLWKHVIIGVSFWKFTQSDINLRNKTCTMDPEFCHDEQWFRAMISKELEDKFHIGQEIQFAFIDTWSQTDGYHEEIEQESFERETSILWNFAQSSEEFVFKSIQDVLDEINELKNEVKYLKGIIETNITEILRVQDILLTTTEETSKTVFEHAAQIKIAKASINVNSEDIVDNSVDITNLKIQQGHMADTVSNHGVQILDNTENIIANQENINIAKGNIQANRDNIETNEQSIDTNKKDIIENTQEIQLLGSKHQELADSFEKSKIKFQELADSFEKSNIKFHAETELTNTYWPDNTVVTYTKELVDTHNALNMPSGTFTAPFDGIFGFIFYTYFASDNGYLIAYHNNIQHAVHMRYSSSCDTNEASTVYFALDLKQGDTVKINSSNIEIYLYIPAKFMGFLLE